MLLHLITAMLLATGPARALDLQSCDLAAEIQLTNKIELHGLYFEAPPPRNQQPVPGPVAGVLKKLAAEDALGADEKFSPVQACSDYFVHIDRLAAPKGRHLFVSQSGLLGPWFFDLVLYDPATQTASTVAARLGAKWTTHILGATGYRFGLLDPEQVSWEDLYHDGNPVLVFQTLAHNGTMYDAMIYHYMHVGPSLDLNPILARETELYLIGRGPYRRSLVELGQGKWSLKTTFGHKDVGHVIVESSAPGAPFRVLSFHPKRAKDEILLIGPLSDDPDDMLVHGYTYQY